MDYITKAGKPYTDPELVHPSYFKAWDVEGIRPIERLVLICLCSVADYESYVATIPQKDIAKLCNIGRVTVIKCLNSLEEKDVIARMYEDEKFIGSYQILIG